MTGPAAAGSGRLRAGHADRERVLEALKDAFVDGRLTRDELDARAGRALAARTCAELTTLTSDIPVVPAGPARPPAPVRRRPLARAAARSGGCLIIAAAAVRLGALADPNPPGGPAPYHSFAPLCFLLAFFAVLTALGFIIHGVGTAWEQRHPDGKLPPPPRRDVTRRIS